jgi:hypothetical protein
MFGSVGVSRPIAPPACSAHGVSTSAASLSFARTIRVASALAFANALQRGGYATDPDYASKLLSVVSRVDEIQGRAGRPEIAGDVKPFKPEAQTPIATPRINNA